MRGLLPPCLSNCGNGGYAIVVAVPQYGPVDGTKLVLVMIVGAILFVLIFQGLNQFT